MKKLVIALPIVALVVGVLALVAPTPAHAKPCVIRCSDLGGCQTCCVERGGWVCR